MLLISEIIVKFTLVIDITPVECDDHQSIRQDSTSVLPLMYKLGFPQFSSPSLTYDDFEAGFIVFSSQQGEELGVITSTASNERWEFSTEIMSSL